MSSAFGSALFLTPQNQNQFSANSSPSTKESSQGSQDQIQSVMKFSDLACKETKATAPFTTRINNNDFQPQNRVGLNFNLTNTVKLDSKFNQDFIEEPQENNIDNSILGTSA